MDCLLKVNFEYPLMTYEKGIYRKNVLTKLNYGAETQASNITNMYSFNLN